MHVYAVVPKHMLSFVCILFVGWAACSHPNQQTCITNDDCISEQRCLSGFCQASSSSAKEKIQEDPRLKEGSPLEGPLLEETSLSGETARTELNPTPADGGSPDNSQHAESTQPSDANNKPDDKPAPSTAKKFASQPLLWRVPTSSFSRTSYSYGSKWWVTMDIDGDNKPDLVWTQDPQGSTSFTQGGAHWKVFRNTGSGFATQPILWRVPASSFSRTSYSYGSKWWVTMDLDGDNKPDLVWTQDPQNSMSFTEGSPHWKVFRNTGSGFATQPILWRVPASSFSRTSYSYGSKWWVTMDLDGDKKPDLVWTQNPQNSTSFTEGGAHWKVFRNTGSGFAMQASSWRVPASSFSRTSYSYGSKWWVTMDIDGDNKPDLVWTQDPQSSTSFTEGSPHWKVFRNTGSGFTTQASSWRVPTSSFSRTSYSYGSKWWVTMDIDGDNKPDLVWTQDPQGSTSFTEGSPHWKVFRNTGSGFATQASSWRVPASSFSRTSYSYGTKWWVTMDIDGDNRPDLVWTQDPQSSTSFTEGGAHWKVFRNE